MIEVLGWFSSFILVLTISNQVYKQWRSGSSEGVSKWLFVGQITASTGFTIYSVLVRNWVFVVTNSLMLLSAIVGIVIVVKHRRMSAKARAGPWRQVPPARHTPEPGDVKFERLIPE